MSGSDAVFEIIKMDCFLRSPIKDSYFKEKSMMYLLSFLYDKCWDGWYSKCLDN